jgi:hypothetical protein
LEEAEERRRGELCKSERREIGKQIVKRKALARKVSLTESRANRRSVSAYTPLNSQTLKIEALEDFAIISD